MPVVMPQTKCEGIALKSVRRDAFLAVAGVPREVLDLDCHNFLLLTPRVTILILLECL